MEDDTLELTLSQKFFIEKLKIEMERMTKSDLQEHIINLVTLQYRKDKLWLKLIMNK